MRRLQLKLIRPSTARRPRVRARLPAWGTARFARRALRNNLLPSLMLPLLVLLGGLTACSRDASTLLPTEAGRWWEYVVETTVLDEKDDHRLLITNLGSIKIDGKPYIRQRVQADLQRLLLVEPEGVFRVGQKARRAALKREPDPVLLAPPPDVETGEVGQVRSILAVIESRTFAREDKLRPRRFAIDLVLRVEPGRHAVEVPAGRFDDCVLVIGEGSRFVPADRNNTTAEVHVVEQSWFAPGVGLVKVDRREESESVFMKSGRYTQVLSRYN